MVLDGTWLVHLPKVLWWLVCEGNMAYFLYRLYQPYQPDASNDNRCYSPRWMQKSRALMMVSLWWAATIQLMQAPAYVTNACARQTSRA